MGVAGGERERQEGGMCVAGIRLGWAALGDVLQTDDAQGQADVCFRSITRPNDPSRSVIITFLYIYTLTETVIEPFFSARPFLYGHSTLDKLLCFLFIVVKRMWRARK